MRAFPAFSHDHSRSSLLFLFQWNYSCCFFVCFFYFDHYRLERKKERLVRFHVHLSPLGGFVRPSFSSSEIMSVQALQICGLSCCLSPPAGSSVFGQRQTRGPKLYLEYFAYVLAVFLPLFLRSGALWMAIRTSWG